MFQFPSNGKVYPKKSTISAKNTTNRFNSLQTGKYIQRLIAKLNVTRRLILSFNSLQTGKYIQSLDTPDASKKSWFGFNSLQTGKYIQRKFLPTTGRRQNNGFQFPSNGKVYPKEGKGIRERYSNIVSIPFKRESISKERTKRRR